MPYFLMVILAGSIDPVQLVVCIAIVLFARTWLAACGFALAAGAAVGLAHVVRCWLVYGGSLPVYAFVAHVMPLQLEAHVGSAALLVLLLKAIGRGFKMMHTQAAPPIIVAIGTLGEAPTRRRPSHQ